MKHNVFICHKNCIHIYSQTPNGRGWGGGGGVETNCQKLRKNCGEIATL